MLVQLRDFPDDLADRLKSATHHRTASGAVQHACYDFLSQRTRIASLETKVAALEERLRVQQQVIERARDSAAALLDHVAQGDLLQG